MRSTTKKKPHYDLNKVKNMVRTGDFRMTRIAADSALELGIEDEGAIQKFLLTLHGGDFYKSITSDYNHKEWQDVYRPMIGKTRGYVKFKVASEVVVLSFKEKTAW